MSTSKVAPWQRQARDRLAEAIAHGHLAHGLLICGPARFGKRAVALHMAKRLLCSAPGDSHEPCGACRSCQLFDAGTHPDFALLSFVPVKDGSKLRTEIVIEQVRELSGRMSLTPQYGGAQVVVIDPADALNHAAANALLKTLEEPQPGRYLWLVTAEPTRLPATIRSRCQRLDMRLPRRDEALAWLHAQGHPADKAAQALDAARGHPGLAGDWLADGSLGLRAEVERDLAAIARDDVGITETAQRWTGDESTGLRLRFAADLAVERASSLTDSPTTRRLALWFDQVNRCRGLLRTTVRADLAVAEALLGWRELHVGQRKESPQR